jgi:deazaflavin-dependent oxidoreductase (nitroreductase family)
MTKRSEDSSGGFLRLGVRILKTRWLVRAPIALFRAGAGFLFGGRLLLLEHTGRNSGFTRYVVLEVVSHPAPGTFVVASGFGTRAQWYRNVIAHPRVRLRWSIRPAATAVAHPLDPQESAAIIASYAAKHPRAWAKLNRVFATTLGAPVEGPDAALPVVRFEVVPKQAASGRAV